ncbi:hypothetical protein [Streptomyces sp. TE5632]
MDEAQDLRPGHWKTLRAMVTRDRNDMFLVGDTHQRGYGNQVTLGSFGVNVRGRSARLTSATAPPGRSSVRRSGC